MSKLRLALLLMLASGTAQAQDLMDIARQNMAFDQQQNQQLQMLQQQTMAAQQQLWQSYLQQNGPMLQQEYQRYVQAGNNPPLTFEQFAYYMLITANGTNVQGALQAQQQQFEGQQRAHQTQMQGFADYNAGMRQNSQATSNAVENWDRTAVQGNAPYVDPRTGQTVWLPGSPPPGQPVTAGGNTYAQDRTGTYYQMQGNWWVPVNPAPPR